MRLMYKMLLCQQTKLTGLFLWVILIGDLIENVCDFNLLTINCTN